MFPEGIDDRRKNIYKVNLPYFLLFNDGGNLGGKWVVFWGVPFKNLPDVYLNEREFIRKTNLCLDYVKENCRGYRLIYKAHPNETTEQGELNLSGFDVMKEKAVAEFIIFKNFSKIKHVFSTYSSAAMMSYKLGLDAHIFLPFIESTLTDLNKEGNRNYFKGMPDEFFISNLEEPFSAKINRDNGIDPVLKSNLCKILEQKSGNVWFILGDPGSLISVVALQRLIRDIDPKRKTGLIIEKHHRWGVMDMEEVQKLFDEVKIFPRWLPSLRPQKIWGQVKTAFAIRRFNLSKEDILMCLNYTSFVENCFISYFPTNLRAAFIKKETLEFCYGPKESEFFKIYFQRRGVIFRNKVLEPLLGLKRTTFWEDPARVANYDRYIKPVNHIYDQVYVY